MSEARAALLQQVIRSAAVGGLVDRSLREIAEEAGTSHRMLLYHFGDRAGLVSAVVEAIEADQRALLAELASEVSTEGELIMALWARVSSAEMRPFVRLFFECVGATGGRGLTDPWIDDAGEVAASMTGDADPDRLRLGIAVTRGLLIDVLALDDASPATRSMECFVELWG